MRPGIISKLLIGQALWARASAWLISLPEAPPRPVRAALIKNLSGTWPVFLGGTISTVAVAGMLAVRIDARFFIWWLVFELALAALRCPALIACRRAADGDEAPVRLYALLSVLWAGSVGAGAFASLASGDRTAALLACVAAAALLGGICFRFFAAPRLVLAMLLATGIPSAAGCLLTGEPVLMFAGFLLPLYIYAMNSAVRRMNHFMVSALCAEHEQGHHARHDPLTGLLNRTGLAEAFETHPKDEPLACFFMDLDGFKRINDTLGHAAGDRLLGMVAQRLRSSPVSAGAVLARLGGDEFVALVPCAGGAEAEAIGEELAEAAVGLPYLIDAQGVVIGASVGGALRPDHGSALQDLVAVADLALYRAKSHSYLRCLIAAPDGSAPELPVTGQTRVAAA